jgi:hypothetical protein
MHAVGSAAERTGTGRSNFSACSIWLIAMSIPPQPNRRSPVRCGSAGPQAGDISRARHPAPLEIVDLGGRADADIFAHAEGLRGDKVMGGFVAEAVAGDVEHEPRSRNLAAAGD